ncbi:dicarboxylate transporter/tellurite-resistance protein TehA [Agrobacterium sp. AGB01]|uniref:dicarboxylate transporter/tellurite-resistance protein TehA n=1 Tax=Agrobacterium sp. AGB01 TaxID=2769302 RepID=UPI00177DFAEE|nr:dicarboxylate transporter/tellurite-resistance protein TehA [Agrobacterium sp. AGB01]MBD9388602.1 dicarboxylate transporter/tellurite-resistance protein TehA [Agrobacterium sp. AGB01]
MSTKQHGLRSVVGRVPASFFGIVLGLVGLGSTWRTAADAWNFPTPPGEFFSLAGVAVWCLVTMLYAAKWVLARHDALAETEHAIQCCFVGLVGVATMLAGLALLPYSRTATEILLVLGFAATFGFALWRTGRLWQGARDPAASTPVLYLPTVAGSFVTAIVMGALGHQEMGQLAFGAGLLSWLAIESILLHRLYTMPELTPALRATLGIQLAPPAVGSVAYLSVNGGVTDIFVHALFGYAVLQLAILLRLTPWILKQPFSASYWAFTFGLTAISTAGVKLASASEDPVLQFLSLSLFIMTNAGLFAIIAGSIILLAKGRFLPASVVPVVTTSPQ